MNRQLFADVAEGRRYLRERQECLEEYVNCYMLRADARLFRGDACRGNQSHHILESSFSRGSDGEIKNRWPVQNCSRDIRFAAWRSAQPDGATGHSSQETALIRSVLGRDPCVPVDCLSQARTPASPCAPPRERHSLIGQPAGPLPVVQHVHHLPRPLVYPHRSYTGMIHGPTGYPFAIAL